MTAGPRVITGLRVSVATRRNRRDGNEDAVGAGGWVLYGEDDAVLDLSLPMPAAGLRIALADGMGGLPAGEVAARTAAAVLGGSPDGECSLERLFERADDAVRAAGPGSATGLGCTAAVVELRPDGDVLVGSVGDVRVYRVADGYPGQVTRDDRCAADTRVLQCLGGRRRTVLDPHGRTVRAVPGDRLILTTDGVHDAIDPGVLARVAVAERNRATRDLLAAAVSGGAGDNLTAVVVDLTGDVRDATAPVADRPSSVRLPAAAAGPSGPSSAGAASRARVPGRWSRRRP